MMNRNEETKKLRIVAFGIRALPPVEGCGGAETFAEELYTRLSSRGHEVTVYCRKRFGENKRYPSRYRNLHLIYLPTLRKMGFDTLFHSFLCTLHIVFFDTGDVVHIHNAGNSLFIPLLRLFRKKCFVSIDGIDWKRTRWSWYAKLYLKAASLFALRVSNRVIVDNRIVQEYYKNKYNIELDYLPYGANITKTSTKTALSKYDLEQNKYILFIGRFSIEKGVHYLIEAFERIDTNMKLVLVGDDLFNHDWVKKLKSTKDHRIVFTGFLYGSAVDELIQHCYFYVQPSDVEGLSPVILRVMGSGKCVLASDIPENRIIVEQNGFLFKKGDTDSLKDEIKKLLIDSRLIQNAGSKSREYVEHNYSWDRVAEGHLHLFFNS